MGAGVVTVVVVGAGVLTVVVVGAGVATGVVVGVVVGAGVPHNPQCLRQWVWAIVDAIDVVSLQKLYLS